MRKSPKIDFFRDPLTRTVQPQDSFAVLPAPNVSLEILLCMIIVYLREAAIRFSSTPNLAAKNRRPCSPERYKYLPEYRPRCDGAERYAGLIRHTALLVHKPL